MVGLRYASRYRCDFCGKIADVAPGGDEEVYPPPVPAGWLLSYTSGDPLALRAFVEGANGERFSDFCDDCLTLPLGTLLSMLTRKLSGGPAG